MNERNPRQAEDRQHRHAVHRAVQARLRNQFIQDVHPLNPNGRPNMVGEAFTLRYIPAREDLNPITVFLDPRPSAAQGGRAVPAGRGAGDRQPQGCARGLGRLDPGHAADGARRGRRGHRWRLPRLARDRRAGPCRPTTPPEAPTNLTLHQALDINVPIGCGDVPVFPGDVVVGDREGVIVMPAHRWPTRSPTKAVR
jgi:hypothetical protein